jgi:hypothetical protein
MREEQEWLATGPIAAQPSVDGPAARDWLDDLRCQAGIRQVAGDPACREELAVRRVRRGRIDGSDPDQLAQRLDEFVDGDRPCPVIETA